MSKPMDNADLNSFINNDAKPIMAKPWNGLDPTSKRVGVSGYNVSLNDYEKTVLDEAAKKEGGASTAFIRQSALKRAKIILGID